MTCNTFSDLIIFYYVKMGLEIIYTALPIIVIVMTVIDACKVVFNGNNEFSHKFWNNLFKRIILASVIFIIPTIINSFLYFVDVDDYQHCFDMATSENIERLEKEEEAKRELERKKQEEEERRKAEERRQRQNEGTGGGNYNIGIGASGSVNNALGIPYYKQCDSRWGKIKYDIGGATLCNSSCGYTSLAMIAAGLTRDYSINPYTIIKDIRGLSDGQLSNRGYGAASTHDLTSSKYLTRYGIQAQNISSNSIVSNLRSGHPVIILVPGHYMALSMSSNGNIVLLDPFTNWADKRRKSGEYTSLNQITSAYGGIRWAAAYSLS